MATRSERDKNKLMHERHQVILSTLLKDEDNKYCVDCDAKGPRWASWNLGIFLCIRCAGIHRNLGVHISKVKSVNLDTWTPEQIASVEDMGNSRARAVYEANIPDGFRRPQTDSALESFIRAKYETKKYIAKEWVPPKPRTQLVEEKKEKKRPKPKSSVQLSNATVNRPETSKASPPKAEVKAPEATPQTQTTSAVDLLGLDTPSVSNNVDPFGDFLAANTTPNPNVNAQQAPAQQQQQQPVASAVPQSQPLQNGGATEENLFGESKESQEKSQSTKDSILALYGNAQQPQQQMFGVPGGVYVPQQQQQPGIQQGMYGMPQQQQQQQYAMQQNGMMANQGMMQQPQVSQGMMQQPQVSQGMMQGQGNMMMANNMQAMQQPNMMQNNMAHQNMMGVGQQQMGQQNMGLQNMGQQNMGQQQMGGGMMQNNMYNMPQQNQQQNFQQVQNQMASMKLGGGVGGYTQQPGMVGGPTGASWGGAPQGQTLSTNLWQ